MFFSYIIQALIFLGTFTESLVLFLPFLNKEDIKTFTRFGVKVRSPGTDMGKME